MDKVDSELSVAGLGHLGCGMVSFAEGLQLREGVGK